MARSESRDEPATMTRGLTREPRCDAGTLVRLAAGALEGAVPPAVVEVAGCADAACDGLCWAGGRWPAPRWPALRRCRAWRLAALPRRAMTPLCACSALHARPLGRRSRGGSIPADFIASLTGGYPGDRAEPPPFRQP